VEEVVAVVLLSTKRKSLKNLLRSKKILLPCGGVQELELPESVEG